MASSGGLPLLWSSEEPNLYVLVLTLVDKDGQHLESESAQVCAGPVTVQASQHTTPFAWITLACWNYLGVCPQQSIYQLSL